MPKVKDDEPLWLPVGTAVSARYHGAYCEAYVMSVKKTLRCRIRIVKPKDQQNNVLLFTDDAVQNGTVGISNTVSVKDSTGKILEGRILAVEDQSEYHVRFNDGDEKTLRRSAITLRSGKHFGSASEPNLAAVLAAATAAAAGATASHSMKTSPKTISKIKSDGGSTLHAPPSSSENSKKLSKKKSSDVDTPPKAAKAANGEPAVSRDPPVPAPVISESPARRNSSNKTVATATSSRPTFPTSTTGDAAAKEASAKISMPAKGEKRSHSTAKTKKPTKEGLEKSGKKKKKDAAQLEDVSDDAKSDRGEKDGEETAKKSKRSEIHSKNHRKPSRTAAGRRLTPRKQKKQAADDDSYKATTDDDDDLRSEQKTASTYATSSSSSSSSSSDEAEAEPPVQQQPVKRKVGRPSKNSSANTSARSSRTTTPHRKPLGRRPSAASVSRMATPNKTSSANKKRRPSKSAATDSTDNSEKKMKKPEEKSSDNKKPSLFSPSAVSDAEQQHAASSSTGKRRSLNKIQPAGANSSPGTPKSPPLLVSSITSGTITPTKSSNRRNKINLDSSVDDDQDDLYRIGPEESPSPSQVPPPPPLLHADGSLFSPSAASASSANEHNLSFSSSVHAAHAAAESIALPMLRLLDDTSDYEIGKLVIIEVQTRKQQSLPYIPAIVVHPHATKRIRAVDPTREYIVRSLADNSFLKLLKQETLPLNDMEALEALIPSSTSDAKVKQLFNLTKIYMREGKLPPHPGWNEKVLFEGAQAADHDAESVLSSTTTTTNAARKSKDAANTPSTSTGGKAEPKKRGRRPRDHRGNKRRRHRTLSNDSSLASSSTKTDTTGHSSSTTVTITATKSIQRNTMKIEENEHPEHQQQPISPPPVLLSINSVTGNLLPEIEHAVLPPVAPPVVAVKLVIEKRAAQQQHRSQTPADEPPVTTLVVTKAVSSVLPPVLSLGSISELPTLPYSSTVYPPMRYSPISPAKVPSSRTSPPPQSSVTSPAQQQHQKVGGGIMSPPSVATAEPKYDLPTLDDLPTLPAVASTTTPTQTTTTTANAAVSAAPASAVSVATPLTGRSKLLRGRALSTVSAGGSTGSLRGGRGGEQDVTASTSPRKRAYRDAMRSERFQNQRKQVDFAALKPGAVIKLLYQNPKTQHIDAYPARVTDTFNDDDAADVAAASAEGGERRGRLVFVHYHGWNQRFDEWVDASRILHVVSLAEAGSAQYVPTTSYHNRALARLTSKKFSSNGGSNGGGGAQPRKRLASGAGLMLTKQQSLRDDAVEGSPAGAGKTREFDSESISSSVASDIGTSSLQLSAQIKPAVVAIDLELGNAVDMTPNETSPQQQRKRAFFGSITDDDAVSAATSLSTSTTDAENSALATAQSSDETKLQHSNTAVASPSSLSIISSADDQILPSSSPFGARSANTTSISLSSASSSTSRLLDSKSSTRPQSSSVRGTTTNASDSATSLPNAEQIVATSVATVEKTPTQPSPYSSTLPFTVPAEPSVGINVMLRETQLSSKETQELRQRVLKRSQRFSRSSVESNLPGQSGPATTTSSSASKARKHADLSMLRTPQERVRLKSSLTSAYKVLTRQLEHNVPPLSSTALPLPELPHPPSHVLYNQQQRHQEQKLLAECYRDAATSLNVVHNPLFVPPSQRVVHEGRPMRAESAVDGKATATLSVDWQHVAKLVSTLSNDCSVKSNEFCVPIVGYATQYYDALGRLKLPLDGSRKLGYLATSSMLAANFKADDSSSSRQRNAKDSSNRAVVVEGVELILPPANLPESERLKALENLQQKLRLMYQIKQRRVVKMLKIREEVRLKEIKSMRKECAAEEDTSADQSGEAAHSAPQAASSGTVQPSNVATKSLPENSKFANVAARATGDAETAKPRSPRISLLTG